MAGFFGFGDYTKPGPGVSKDGPQKHRFIVFFEVFFRKFWKLLQLNMLYFVVSLPIIFIYLILSAMYFDLHVPQDGEFAEQFQAVDLMLRFCVALWMLLIFGNGPFTCGYSYVLRNFSQETHAWVWSDFWEHTRKNFGQGMLMMLINLVVIWVAAVNFRWYFAPQNDSVWVIGFGVMFLLVMLVYTLMQLYIFPLMLTFKLSFAGVLRNALLFALMKPLQGVILLLFSVVVIVAFLFLMGYSIIGVILAPLILLAFTSLAIIFYTFGVIQKVMIGEEGKAEEEATFRDTV